MVKIPLYLQEFAVCGSFLAANSNVMSVNMPNGWKVASPLNRILAVKSSSPSGTESMSQENVCCVGLLHVSITGICYFKFQMSSRNFVPCGL